MCGISGIWNFKKAIDNNMLIKMKCSLSHRGPDDDGVYIDPSNRVGLVHTRLSVIDLSENGHQPMIDMSSNMVITYNGEIYNYKELKEELSSLGHNFFSSSDTEVILKSYSEWGDKCLKRLRGMFSFCIFDMKNQELFLARDRFGMKPLYYHNDNDLFVFASEIHTILESKVCNPEKNPEAIRYFLSFGYIPPPVTFYKKILALEKGCFLKVAQNMVKKFQYADIEDLYLNDSAIMSEKDAIKHTREALLDTIRHHLVADVDVGVFLSGGVDSSSIVSLMQRAGHKKIKTVSVTFSEPQYDESKYARLISNKFGTDHKEVHISYNNLMENLEKILSFMDQPTADGINVYFAAKAAKSAGLKVVLSGLGGDELFGGYSTFKTLPLCKNFLTARKYKPSFTWLPFLSTAQRTKLKSIEENKEHTFSDIYFIIRSIFSEEEIRRVLSENIGAEVFYEEKEHSFLHNTGNLYELKNDFTKTAFLETSYYMSNQLLRDGDVFSMCHSLEMRVPFVDHKIIEAVNIIPPKYKTTRIPKKLLINSVNNLPSEIYNRPKKGFTFPLDIWMRKEEFKTILERELLQSNIFDKVYIKELLQSFYLNKANWHRIWSLFVLNKFFNI